MGKTRIGEIVDGIVCRVRPNDAMSASVAHVDQLRRALGFGRGAVHIALTPEAPFGEALDAAQTTLAVVEAYRLACTYPHLSVIVDTFADADRAYSAHMGLVDRRYNLTEVGVALRETS